jgi:hypothetical protein
MFHFCGNRTQRCLEKESSSRHHPTKISKNGRTQFIERKKKKRRRQEEQFALFVANAAMIRADAQEKKNGGEAGTSREKARKGSTGSSSPRS